MARGAVRREAAAQRRGVRRRVRRVRHGRSVCLPRGAERAWLRRTMRLIALYRTDTGNVVGKRSSWDRHTCSSWRTAHARSSIRTRHVSNANQLTLLHHVCGTCSACAPARAAPRVAPSCCAARCLLLAACLAAAAGVCIRAFRCRCAPGSAWWRRSRAHRRRWYAFYQLLCLWVRLTGLWRELNRPGRRAPGGGEQPAAAAYDA